MPRKFLLIPKYTQGHYDEHEINGPNRLEAQKPKQWNFFFFFCNGHFLKQGIQNYNLATKRLKDIFGRRRYFGAGPSTAPSIAPEAPAVNYGRISEVLFCSSEFANAR